MQYKKTFKRSKRKGWYREKQGHGEMAVCSNTFNQYFELIYPGESFDIIISDIKPNHNQSYIYKISEFGDISFQNIVSKDNTHFVLDAFEKFIRKIKAPTKYIWAEQ